MESNGVEIFMDSRKALPAGTILNFTGMSCIVEEEAGRGSNTIVYRGSYADATEKNQYHHVLIKELFPLHKQGKIFRQDDGAIHVELESRETFQLYKRSFEAGNRAHLMLLERAPAQTGANLNTYSLNSTLYTVLGVSGGNNLETLQKYPARSLRSCAVRMLCILDALEAFHNNGLAHLDVSPDNIILIGSGNRERALLIDYNSAIPVGLKYQVDPVVLSTKQGYTAPEVRAGFIKSIGFASDMYSVAAVFYRLLAGKTMTKFQELMKTVPADVLSCPCLKSEPDTVKIWLQAIFTKGLRPVPEKRYQTTDEMRRDIEELIDRIDGVGITHWALWEAGRKQAVKMIRDNPSLAFIKDSRNIFPSMLTDGKSVYPSGEYIRNTSENIMLLGGGGMGKTTALLRFAFSGNVRYSPEETAVIYFPLYGWQDGDKSFIVDSLLESLHFRTETNSFAEARKVLYEILSRPLEARTGTKPVLLLLLDGFNELSGDTRPLVEEIIRLSLMLGVRILISGRTDEAALPFARLHMAELTEDTVHSNLAKEGLSYPDAKDMQDILRVPLMLSMYISSGRITGKQVRISSTNELLQAYLDAMKDKVIRELPDETELRWQIEAAIDFVLPAVSAEIHKHKRALEDRELLPVVEKCFRVLNGSLSRRFFPEWIGRTAAIRGNARNAEEWYGQIVHALLWKRLGLIIRDRMGRYMVSHQIIQEYLLSFEKANRRKMRNYHSVLAMLAAVLSACLVWTLLNILAPKPYNEAYAENIMEQALSAYVSAGGQYELFVVLADCAANTPQDFLNQLNVYKSSTPYISVSGHEAVQNLDAMMKTGKVMPWSGKPMNQSACRELLTLAEDREADYRLFAAVLEFVMTDENAHRHYASEYPQLLQKLLEIDAKIASELFQIVCYPHMMGKYADSLTAEEFNGVLKNASRQNKHLSNDETLDSSQLSLTILKGDKGKCISDLYSCGAVVRYKNVHGLERNL